jgi:hypothetical protein
MTDKSKILRALGLIVLGIATATAAYLYFGTGGGPATAAGGSPPVRPKTTSGTRVTPSRPEASRVPQQMFDEPFVDGRTVGDVAAAARELSFKPTIAPGLGRPTRIFVHDAYRPQALALVYDHPVDGRLALTEEPIDMPADLQRQGLEQMAAGCDPATGCVGSWTMQPLFNGNRALVISNAPAVNAVVWIHDGGIRYQLMGPGTTLSANRALAVANAIEAAAK